MWSALFLDDGSFNKILGVLSAGPAQDWVQACRSWRCSLANVWRGTAFSMLVYSAALSEVPKEIEESATMDGAGTVQRLWSVTLPMIRRTITTNLMLITLQTLSVFGLIWTMTRGGPSNKSTTLPIFAYQQAFQLSQLGYGTALALVLLAIGGVFSLVYLRALRLDEVRSMSAVTAIRGRHQVVNKVVVNVALLLLAAGFFVPLLWLVLAAFDARAGAAVAWPHPWTSTNFKAILTWDTTYRPMLNGAILCGGGTIVRAGPGARGVPALPLPVPGQAAVLLTILFATGLPITAIMVPVYGLFVQVNLIDTLSGTILFMATTALPISIWLTKNFMDGVPIEVEEAAWTDGAGAMQGLRTIVLPLMWPGLAVVTIYTFIGLWGNFFVPSCCCRRPTGCPPRSASTRSSGSTARCLRPARGVLHPLLAPAVLLYLLLSRRLGGAFSFSGAVKG